MGDATVLGAPNALKGGSLYGRISARQGISENLCSVLASDYYYPALLGAAFLLDNLGLCTLDEAWAMISSNPAKALGLDDRGDITEGKRADIVLVDRTDPGSPKVAGTIIAGQLVYGTQPIVNAPF
jgi:alpha-D-ribose 1-methylphosphonate 5-triphosphate diphosphatase